MKKNIKTLVLALLSISLVVGFYYYLNNRSDNDAESNVEVTEVMKVIDKNLTDSYPATPREVVKFYNRILCCFYNEEYTDEEFEQLADQARALLDDELLEANPRDTYISNLKMDVSAYKSAEKVISTATVCSSADIQYKKVAGAECAYVTSAYFTKSSLEYSKTNQEYVLRKDASDRWKIVAFKKYEGENFDD